MEYVLVIVAIIAAPAPDSGERLHIETARTNSRAACEAAADFAQTNKQMLFFGPGSTQPATGWKIDERTIRALCFRDSE